MKIMITSDLHGNTWKYKTLLKEALRLHPGVVINAGDMFPNDGNNLHRQKEYIQNQINDHFKEFNDAKIHYVCFPGNDDLIAFDTLFQEVCDRYEYVKHIAQRKVTIGGDTFIGFNLCVDYTFMLKNRGRKETHEDRI